MQGTGVPGHSVLIILDYKTHKYNRYCRGRDVAIYATKPMAEGKQSITITTTDQHNQTKALTHTFEILKAEPGVG